MLAYRVVWFARVKMSEAELLKVMSILERQTQRIHTSGTIGQK
jgi:hypothetical protein